MEWEYLVYRYDQLLAESGRTNVSPLGFPGGSHDQESACNARDSGSIPGLGRVPGEGNGNPLQYFGLENSMDRRA